MLDAFAWDFCQVQYNYANEYYQAGTAGVLSAAERGLAVFVMEPLLGGRLAGKLPTEAFRVFEQAGDAELKSSVDWALAWVWSHPQITMLLSGMAAPEQVDQNVRVANLANPGCMDEKRMRAIVRVQEIFEAANRVPCTGCNYCMPCPRGINIPGCFSAYNASFAHGWFTGVQQYFTASAIRTSAPKLVSNCVYCGACTRHCPQGIDIPARLQDVGRRLTPGPVGAVLKAMASKGNADKGNR